MTTVIGDTNLPYTLPYGKVAAETMGKGFRDVARAMETILYLARVLFTAKVIEKGESVDWDTIHATDFYFGNDHVNITVTGQLTGKKKQVERVVGISHSIITADYGDIKLWGDSITHTASEKAAQRRQEERATRDKEEFEQYLRLKAKYEKDSQ